MAIIKGTSGDDTLTGTDGNDKFNLTQGGNDTAFGGGGNDVFAMGATLTAADHIDGGDGTDSVTLKGDYSAGLVFGATTIVNVEKLQLYAGFNYSFTMNDANVAAGQRLTVNAGALGSANHLTFDGSAETDGGFAVTGGAGNDVLAGGALRDVFVLNKGGNDIVHAGGGNDSITVGAALTAADSIDGGAGNDVLALDGDYSAGTVFGAATVTGVETLQLNTGHSYNLTTADATVAAGAFMTVDGSALGPKSHLVFNGGAESDGTFKITGGGASDMLTGGALADTFDLSFGGDDVGHGGGGSDTFILGAALTAADSIDGGTGNDVVVLNGDYSGGVVFGAATMTSVETLRLTAGHSYTLTTSNATVTSGAVLTVDGSALGASDTLTFNGSAESDGSFSIVGGAGADTLIGGAQADSFDLSHRGNDIAHGGGGNDTFAMGAALTAADSIDGGTGSDTLTLAGDYSAGLVFGTATITGIETLKLAGGNSYTLTTNDANVAAGAVLSVDGSALGGSAHLVFNGTAETDGSFAFIGGAGADTLTGGAQADSFDLSRGGNDVAHGGGGNDTFLMGAALTAADSIDGGAGNDTLTLSGDYSAGLTIGAATLTSVETLLVSAGNDYNLTTNDANVAASQTLIVDAGALGTANHLIFNGAAETDGSFLVVGGFGNDVMTGGAQADTFDLSLGGIDTVHGGGGNDLVLTTAGFSAADTIDGGAGSDTLRLNGDYSAGFTFGAATLTSVETLQLWASHSYNLTTNEGNVAAGQALAIDGSALGVSDVLTFNGAAETDGSFSITGGAANDMLTGGAQADSFDLSHGGNDTAHGGGGNDTLAMGAALTAADSVDGGAGNDVLALNGDYSGGLTLGAGTLTGVETLQFAAGHSYSLTANDGNVAAGQSLTLDGSALGVSDALTFNGAAETDGSFAFIGGAGSDTLTGGAQADSFDLTHGGADSAHGGGGSDVFTLGAAFSATDSIDGGTGSDTLSLSGDYSGGIVFGTATMTNIETLQLAAGHSYNLTVNDANVALGQALTVDANALGAGDALTFNGTAETDGSFAFIGGAGSDTLTGGAQADSFDLTRGSNDIAHGGGGNDTFTLGAALSASDTLDGGTGNDTLTLNGDYSAELAFGAATLTSIETLSLAGGHSYSFTTNDANVASGTLLTVDASALGSGDSLTFNGAAETDGSFLVVGGAGNDVLTGGAQADSFDLSHGGNDTVQGNGGNDIFNAGAVLTGTDSIDGGAGNDTLALNGDYSGGFTFGAATIASIETLSLASGHSYNLVMADGSVAAGATLAVDASALGGGNTLAFDGSSESDGSFSVIGGAGNDMLTGGAQADTIDLSHGGNDIAHGGGGGDTFVMGAALNTADSIDGGSGNDVLSLNGDYSSGFTFGANTIISIETVQLAAGHNYNLTTVDSDVATGATLIIDASALGSSNVLVFDGSAESDGTLDIVGGAGNDFLTGGNGGNVFDLSHGGTDIVSGGQGNNVFEMGAAFDSSDRINGALGGNNTLVLNGTYLGLSVTNSMVADIQTVDIQGSHTISIAWNQSAFSPLTLDASGAGGSLTFDFSAVNDPLIFIGGALTTRITGGAQADTFNAGTGVDTFLGNGGNDTFNFGGNLTAADSIDGGAGSDVLVLGGDYSAGVTLGAATMTNIETLQFQAGHGYNIATNDANVASGQTLTVDASALGTSDHLTFNGAAESDGSFSFLGGAGDDALTGGGLADSFDLSHGGNDIAHGGGGNDTFLLGAALTTADSIDGGAGNDTLSLNGDYSAGFVFGAATVTSIEALQFAAGHSYNLTTDDGNVSAGSTLSVDASALGAGTSLTFNGGAEMDGAFAFVAGAGNDALTGGAQADSFDLTHGGNDTAKGGGGNDTFTLAATLTASDSIDGGSGSDTLTLNGDYSAGLTFGAATVVNIELLQLAAGHSYNFTTNDGNVASGATMAVDGSALGAGDVLTFNGTAETDGSFSIAGGAGNDVLSGGAQGDTFDLSHGGNDAVHGNGGNDTFALGAALTASDQIDGGAGSDTLSLNGDYSTGLTFGSVTMTNVETLQLAAGHNYTLTTNDATVAFGTTLTLDASALGAADTLAFNGAAESDGSFDVLSGAGNDVLTGGAQADTFDLSHGGNDNVHGNNGNDTFLTGGALTVADSIDGGAGNDTLVLNGGYSAGLTFGAATMTNVETLQVTAGNSYNLTLDNANVAAGQTLTVDATGLTVSDQLIFNGGAEINGGFLFKFAGGYSAADQLTGSTTTEQVSAVFTETVFESTLELNGDYSTGLTFASGSLANIGILKLDAGHSYNLTTDDANVGSGAVMLVNAGALGASDTLVFNGAAETDGIYDVQGGAGNDVLTGGAQNDVFDLSLGGSDTVHGGGGNDTFSMGGALNAADSIDGGTGSLDTVMLAGNYSAGLVFGAATITNVEEILLASGLYNLTTNDGNVAAGATLIVNAQAASQFTFDGSAETDGSFSFVTGSANDVVTGGMQADSFDLSSGGNDTVHGGGGNDTFTMGAQLTASDSIDGGTGSDVVILSGNYSGGVTFGAATIANVETLQLAAGNSYNFTTNDANVASGQMLSVDASALTGANTVTFNGGAETDGSFDFKFAANYSTNDHLTGGGNTVQTVLDASLTATAFASEIELNGDYSAGVTFGAGSLNQVGTLLTDAGHSYKITFSGVAFSANQNFVVNAAALGSANALTFNAAAETHGLFYVEGGTGNDVLTGGGDGTNFDISLGGTDTVTGSSHNDIVYAGGALDSTDVVNGGGGTNTLILNGNYSAGFTDTSTILNFANITLIESGFNYKLTIAHEITLEDSYVTINATSLTHALTWDSTADDSNWFNIDAGSGSDVLHMNGGGGTIDFSAGGNDTLTTLEGVTVYMGAALNTFDNINGGQSSLLQLNGDYSAGISFSSTTVVGFDEIDCGSGFNYTLQPDAAAGISGNILYIRGPATGGWLHYDGISAAGYRLSITGGTGDDILKGSGANDILDAYTGGTDTLQGRGGADSIDGATAGHDTFVYTAVGDSIGTAHDTLQYVNFSTDFFSTSAIHAVAGIDAAVTSGALNSSNFDTTLAAAVGSAQLEAYHAILFTATSGTLSGHTIMVVDENGVAGYQAGADLVMDVTGATGTLTVSDFI